METSNGAVGKVDLSEGNKRIELYKFEKWFPKTNNKAFI